MNNKRILTQSSRCNSCGYKHLPPFDLYNKIKWYLELDEGYHRTACSDFNPIIYPKELLLKLLEIFELEQAEHIPLLPSNVSRQDFMEVEQEVMNILKNCKSRII